MKGKKIDSEFVSSYIENCISNNIFQTEDILKLVQDKISEIDNKIKEVDQLKKIRCKLLDVVTTLQIEKPTSKDSKTLSLFSIKDKNICSFICKSIKDKPVEIDSLYDTYQVNDINFVIKQLIEFKVVNKSGDYLLRGSMYQDYIDNVMCEKK